MSDSDVKDTRVSICFTKGCPDYGRERPITEKCGCTKKRPVKGAGH